VLLFVCMLPQNFLTLASSSFGIGILCTIQSAKNSSQLYANIALISCPFRLSPQTIARATFICCSARLRPQLILRRSRKKTYLELALKCGDFFIPSRAYGSLLKNFSIIETPTVSQALPFYCFPFLI
jgi:hypothetical protein